MLKAPTKKGCVQDPTSLQRFTAHPTSSSSSLAALAGRVWATTDLLHKVLYDKYIKKA